MDKKFAFIVLFSGLCSYLIQAFVLLEANPANWERLERISMLTIWALALVLNRMIDSRI